MSPFSSGTFIHVFWLMRDNNNQLWRLNRPCKFSLGAILGLWLLTANGFNGATETDTFTTLALRAPTAAPLPDIRPVRDETRLAEQRALYQRAEQALKHRHYENADHLMQQLQDYPLYPYLQYRQLKRQLGDTSGQQVSAFLDANDNSIIGDRFRTYLLRYYARHQRWDDFIDNYRPLGSTSLHCKYLAALLKTPEKQQALEQVKELWLVGRSQPRSCDAVFDAWEAAGYLSEELVWQRIELAMERGRTRLARHIGKKLSSQADREVIYLWSQIHRKPQLSMPARRLNNHPMGAAIRLHGVKRMAARDVDQAVTLWNKMQQLHMFTRQQHNLARRSIGLSMARSHHPDAMQWLSRVEAEYVDTGVQEWLIRSAIRQGDWSRVAQAIEQLPLAEQSNLRWQFWWAYAHEQLGNYNDAEGIYHYLAGRRSYYGFLAADRLHRPYSFENRPLDIEERELAIIGHYPEVMRARELFKLGKIIDARREWRQLTLSLSNRGKLAASQLAHSWGWHDRAIVTMGKTDYRDDIALRFPLPMKDKVESYSQQQRLETAWTYAIIRRESAFMSDARSSQGALGLMQLMPGTARHVSRILKLRYRGQYSLLGTDTNLRLGTSYLGQMLKRLDSQAVLATAAYNAGPHRVETWLPESQPMDAIRWVETIPFHETREYVSNVLAYTIIYQHLMSDSYTRLAQRMPPVPAKNPATQTAERVETAGNNNT
jgi:soluble lytic murein transglycosylase